jgi:hypothetical protein
MVPYIQSMIDEMPENMIGTVANPAASHLFAMNTCNPDHLNERESEDFVQMVMQLLYLSQRARTDFRTAVSFLCTRLQKADRDD